MASLLACTEAPLTGSKNADEDTILNRLHAGKRAGRKPSR